MGCQQVRSKRELIRIVRTPDGQIRVDRSGRQPGRGAYVCPRPECLETAIRTHRLERALGQPISGAVVEELRGGLRNV